MGVHNRWVEGNKAFILPGVAALVLLGLLVLRGQATVDPVAPESGSLPAAPGVPAKGVKAQIREAIATAGDPLLDASASDALSLALQAVIDRCRRARPHSASLPIEVSVEVIAAQSIGVRVERAEVVGELPASLVGCVREGILGSKPADIGETGRFSGALEFGVP